MGRWVFVGVLVLVALGFAATGVGTIVAAFDTVPTGAEQDRPIGIGVGVFFIAIGVVIALGARSAARSEDE